MTGQIAKIPTPDSDPNSQIIDAEFEVKSGPAKTETESVSISPEEQAKLDESFKKAEEKQGEQDAAELNKAKEALGKKFGKSPSKNRSEGEAENWVSKEWTRLSEGYQKDDEVRRGDANEKRKEWVSELRSRIEEQEKAIEQTTLELEREKKEIEEVENIPWYSNLFGKVLGSHYDDISAKEFEMNKKAEQIRKMKSNLRASLGDLDRTIKG